MMSKWRSPNRRVGVSRTARAPVGAPAGATPAGATPAGPTPAGATPARASWKHWRTHHSSFTHARRARLAFRVEQSLFLNDWTMPRKGTAKYLQTYLVHTFPNILQACLSLSLSPFYAFRQELLAQRSPFAAEAAEAAEGAEGAEAAEGLRIAAVAYPDSDLEGMLLQELVAGELPPSWWRRCKEAAKRKALLMALRVGNMQAVYAMQPESTCFRAELECFEPDASFLSEALRELWADAEDAHCRSARMKGLRSEVADATARAWKGDRCAASVAWLLQRGAPAAVLLPEEPGPAALAVRLRGLRLLQDLGEQAAPAATAVAGCLRDPEVHGRRAAAEALACLGAVAGQAPRAVPRLLRLLEQEANPQCRESAARALGSLGPEGRQAAESALRHPDLDVRGLACTALEACLTQATQATQALLSWLQDGGAPEAPLRARAVQALGRLGDSRALPLLVAFAADPDPSVREASLLALGAGACSSCEWDLVLPTLAAALDDAEDSVREAAARALAREEPEKKKCRSCP
ncbi:unnamed protein product [Symbiodinium natans]|uniref:Uncharacterized protein n=1 Tax=Symbiodinium natans TaxID=878477 RepID=A0A812VFR0_9DINO|nr:unnamed protein product [Symbiodinium natans]